MPTFKNFDNLCGYVVNVTTKNIAEVVSDVSEKLLNKAVDETVYKDISPNSFYENTFGLRNNAMAFETKYGGGKIGIIREINTIVTPDGKYPSDYLDNGNLDNSLYIVEWLNSGHKGQYKRMQIDYKGKMFYELAYNNLTKSSFLKRTVSDMLRTKGYKLKK